MYNLQVEVVSGSKGTIRKLPLLRKACCNGYHMYYSVNNGGNSKRAGVFSVCMREEVLVDIVHIPKDSLIQTC